MILPGCRIVVVLIDVEAGERIVITDKIRMTSLDPVIQDCHGNAFPGKSGQPSLLDVHVETISAIQVPHLRPPEKSLILID